VRSPPQGSGSGAPVSLVVSDPSVVPLSPVLAASGPDVTGGVALVDVGAVAPSPQATRRERTRARRRLTREA
jgi:hypothetical protein